MADDYGYATEAVPATSVSAEYIDKTFKSTAIGRCNSVSRQDAVLTILQIWSQPLLEVKFLASQTNGLLMLPT